MDVVVPPPRRRDTKGRSKERVAPRRCLSLSDSFIRSSLSMQPFIHSFISSTHRGEAWEGSPLYWAVRSGSLELAELLLAHGADPARAVEPQVGGSVGFRLCPPCKRHLVSLQSAPCIMPQNPGLDAADGRRLEAQRWALRAFAPQGLATRRPHAAVAGPRCRGALGVVLCNEERPCKCTCAPVWNRRCGAFRVF